MAQRQRHSSRGAALAASSPGTLAHLLQPSSVPLYRLRNSGQMPHLRLQRAIAGTALSCDSLLAVHPPALEAYHHLMPVMLRASSSSAHAASPSSIFSLSPGSPGIDSLRFLAMHFAARASNYTYGAVFSAAVALRNHVPIHALRLNYFSDDEAVIVDFALRMGTIPSSLTNLSVDSVAIILRDPAATESIILAIAFGGIIGRLTHLLGVDIEAALVRPVQFIEAIGWTQGSCQIVQPADPLQEMPTTVLRTDLLEEESPHVSASATSTASSSSTAGATPSGHSHSGTRGLVHFPSGSSSASNSGSSSASASRARVHSGHGFSFGRSLGLGSSASGSGSSTSGGIFSGFKTSQSLKRFDAVRLQHVPETVSRLGHWLTDRVGHSFPILTHISQNHPRRALAAALDNALSRNHSTVPLRAKYLAALVFANVVSDRSMAEEFAAVCATSSKKRPVSAATIRVVQEFSRARLPLVLRPSSGTGHGGIPDLGRPIDVSFDVPELSICSDLNDRERMIIVFTRSAIPAWSSDVNPVDPALPRSVVGGLDGIFDHEEVVEICWWLSLVQCLHHLYQYHMLASYSEDSVNNEAPVPYMGEVARRARDALEPRSSLPPKPEATSAATAYDDQLRATLVSRHRRLVPPDPAAAGGSGTGTSSMYSRVASLRRGRHTLGTRGSSRTGGTGSSRSRRLEDPHPDTVASMLNNYRVSFAQLKVKHYPMLRLEKVMLGAAPNSDQYLAIFPPGFRTAMLIIPNMLNVPQLLLGTGTPSSIIGVAMHYSSRASKSRYCSLHTCVFALRRGVPAEVIRSNAFSEQQAVAVDAALRLGTFPSTMTKECRDLLYQVHTADDVDWIIMAISMMGFLQKFMDLCGCQLEQASYDQAGDFLTSLGWGPGKHLIAAPADRLQELDRDKGLHGDTVWTNIQALPFVPPLLLWDKKVTARVPSTWPAVGHWLLNRVGFHFPIFGRLRHGRAIRAIAAALSINLDPALCNVPPSTKLLCGVIFGTKAKNPALVADMKRCALRLGSHLLPDTCKVVTKFAREEIDFEKPITLSQTALREAGADLTLADRRALLFAKASSTSPSMLTPIVLGGMEELFSPAAVIEQLVWMGLLQMLHRLYLFFMDPDIAPDANREEPQSEFFGPPSTVLGDERVNPDRARSHTYDELNEMEQVTESSMSNLTLEDRGKGSIRRQPGSERYVLHGADPVYLDERLTRPVALSSEIYGPAGHAPVVKLPRTGEERLYVPKTYVEEDVDAKKMAKPSAEHKQPGASLRDTALLGRERSDAEGPREYSAESSQSRELSADRSEPVDSRGESSGQTKDDRRTVSFSDEAQVICFDEIATPHDGSDCDEGVEYSGHEDEYEIEDDSSSLLAQRNRLADRPRDVSRPSSGSSPRTSRGVVVSGGVVFGVERPGAG